MPNPQQKRRMGATFAPSSVLEGKNISKSGRSKKRARRMEGNQYKRQSLENQDTSKHLALQSTHLCATSNSCDKAIMCKCIDHIGIDCKRLVLFKYSLTNSKANI